MARYRNDIDEEAIWEEGYEAALEAAAHRSARMNRRIGGVKPRHSLLEKAAYTLTIGIILLTAFLAWPIISTRIAGQISGTLAQPTPFIYPTSDTAALRRNQEQSNATAAEQQAIDQAIPTADTSAPPPLPTQATAAAIHQPIVTADETKGYSPIDLGWAPLPTPTTMLNQEQFDASQASEEQNQLNTAQSGLTEAQKLVQVHEAERNAQAQP